MRAEPGRVLETAFVSTETFDQKTFRRWVENRLPTDINHYELNNGRIVMTPPAGWRHGEIEARLSRILLDFVEKNELGKVFGSSTGYNLPSGDTLEPDVSFISDERWAQGPHVGRAQFLRIVPNLVVEILSPATAHRDRVEKKKIYEANGVEELWLVNPVRRDVTVFQLVRGKYDAGKRFGIRGTLRSRHLPGFQTPTRLLFG
jgi:Uma2 family endonuclease